jgi:xanthine dehydrogenase accessory factor
MSIWSHIHNNLENNKRFVLLVVIESEGSSPGRKGFKMAVSDDGSLLGTIGGGLSEYRLAEDAKRQLAEGNARISAVMMDHDPDAEENRSGMICSGSQIVAFYPLGKEDTELVKTLADNTLSAKPYHLCFSDKGIRLVNDPATFERHTHISADLSEWEYLESVNTSARLFIFGAGHVGFALSRLMQTLDFRIELFDDRDWVDTLKENTYVAEKQVVDYNHIEHLVPDGNDVYAVIMTFNHKGDEIVLRQLIVKNIRYLGMMGSKIKVKTLFNNLLQEGFSSEQIAKVHSPIGLSINSLTPAEIAVSIAAEIISVKNSSK